LDTTSYKGKPAERQEKHWGQGEQQWNGYEIKIIQVMLTVA